MNNSFFVPNLNLSLPNKMFKDTTCRPPPTEKMMTEYTIEFLPIATVTCVTATKE